MNEPTPKPRPYGHDIADRLLYVLDGWTSQDDWNMPTYPYPDTCHDILGYLKAGDDPRALRLLAKVTEGHWCYPVLAAKAPAYVAHQAAEKAIRLADRLARAAR